MRFTDSIKLAAASALAILAGCSSTPFPPGGPGQGQPLPPGASAPPPAGTAVRSWDEYRMRAALRIRQTSGSETFSGSLPDELQAIPVLLVHLNADGSVRDIEVARRPRFAPETIQMAMNAVRRAAPFGPVGNLPRPWQFHETFLYNDELKFQLRTLVEAR